MGKKSFKSGIPSSEITPEGLYFSRRNFIKAAGVAGVAGLLAACAPRQAVTPAGQAAPAGTQAPVKALTDELGDPANTYQDITHYNNYYEFTDDKELVSQLAEGFKPPPGRWR